MAGRSSSSSSNNNNDDDEKEKANTPPPVSSPSMSAETRPPTVTSSIRECQRGRTRVHCRCDVSRWLQLESDLVARDSEHSS